MTMFSLFRDLTLFLFLQGILQPIFRIDVNTEIDKK